MKRILATALLLGSAAAAQDIDASRLSETLRGFAQSGGSGREGRDYQSGTRALDKNEFDEAIRRFDAVIDAKDARSDGAYYWKAYALKRLGHRAEALAAISALRSQFPRSRWSDDAQALEAEIHAQEGHPADAQSGSNEELKLIAINALMQSDPSQAIPILEKVLKGNQSPQLKDRALFVLSQSDSPRARQAMLDMARGRANPDLQFTAVRYISMMGGEESRKELAGIYAASSDLNLKREIIHGYMLSGSKQQLLHAAKSETNPELRREAIRTLAQSGGSQELWELYQAETSSELREEIVHAMLLSGDSAHLAEIARSEKDPKVRKSAIQTLALTGQGGGRTFVDLYRSETDEAIKKELIRGLFLQQNAKGLVELARAEKNPAMKRDIVQQLSLIHSKEATDYMLEVLK